ncbi:MAG: choice-of-anchor D domain-containing protein, partial [Candidatus Hydrogenedentota bacterium]
MTIHVSWYRYIVHFIILLAMLILPSCDDKGSDLPACSINSATLNFGTIMVDQCSANQSFVITNSGSTTQEGAVSENSTDFEITSGDGNYSLEAGQSRTVSVRFCPQSSGVKTCTIELGNSACSDVTCTGTGSGNDCSVSPTSLSFGTIDIGACSSTQSITITNNGTTELSGAVSESCADFEITSGDGSYSLDAGQSHAV